MLDLFREKKAFLLFVKYRSRPVLTSLPQEICHDDKLLNRYLEIQDDVYLRSVRQSFFMIDYDNSRCRRLVNDTHHRYKSKLNFQSSPCPIPSSYVL